MAGLFEVSLTFCLGKTKAASGLAFYLWGSGFLASTVLSMTLLAKAVQTLPLGTAYAIWTGIGAVGTVLIGIFVFKEPLSPQTTLTIKVLHARHPKRNPFLRPFWVLSFYLR